MVDYVLPPAVLSMNEEKTNILFLSVGRLETRLYSDSVKSIIQNLKILFCSKVFCPESPGVQLAPHSTGLATSLNHHGSRAQPDLTV